MPDEPLHWGRGDALTEASGEIIIEGYEQGEEAWLLVDHSERAIFAGCPLPVLSADLENFDVTLVLLAPDGSTTNGAQFVLRVSCIETPVYGRGGTTPVTIQWYRRGVAQ